MNTDALGKALRIGVISIVLISVAAFAMVEVWSIALFQFLAGTLLLVWVLKLLITPSSAWDGLPEGCTPSFWGSTLIWWKRLLRLGGTRPRSPVDRYLQTHAHIIFGVRFFRTGTEWPVIFLLAFVMVQWLPLPNVLHKALAPGSYELYKQSIPGFGDPDFTWKLHPDLNTATTPSVMTTEDLWADATPSEAFLPELPTASVDPETDREISEMSGRRWGSISLNPASTIDSWVLFLVMLGFYYAVMDIFSHHRHARNLIYFFILLGFGMSLFALIQKASGTSEMLWLRNLKGVQGKAFFGVFLNPNHYCAFIELLFPIALGWAFMSLVPTYRDPHYRVTKDSHGNDSITLARRKKKGARIGLDNWMRFLIGIFTTFVMLVSLFMAGSRGGLLASVWGLGCFMLFYLTRMRVSKPNTILFVLIIGVIIVSALGGVAFMGSETVVSQETGRLAPEVISQDIRWALWANVWQAFENHSLMGTGAGTFGEVFTRWRNFGDERVIPIHAESDYMELLLEGGLVGAGLVAWFLLAALRSGRPFENPLQLGVFVGLLTFLLHGIWDFPFHIPANALLFMCVLAAHQCLGRISFAEN